MRIFAVFFALSIFNGFSAHADAPAAHAGDPSPLERLDSAKHPEIIDCQKLPEERFDKIPKFKSFESDALVGLIAQHGDSPEPLKARLQKAKALRDDVFKYLSTHDPTKCFGAGVEDLDRYCTLLDLDKLGYLKPRGSRDAYLTLKDPRFPKIVFARKIVRDKKTLQYSYQSWVAYTPEFGDNNIIGVFGRNDQSPIPVDLHFTQAVIGDSRVEIESQRDGKSTTARTVNQKTSGYAAVNVRLSALGIDPFANGSPCGDGYTNPAEFLAKLKEKTGYDPESANFSNAQLAQLLGSAAANGAIQGVQNVQDAAGEFKDGLVNLKKLATNELVDDPQNPGKKIGLLDLLKRSLGDEYAKRFDACFAATCPEARDCGPLKLPQVSGCTALYIGADLGTAAKDSFVSGFKKCVTGTSDEVSRCFAKLGIDLLATAAGLKAAKLVQGAAKGAQATVALSNASKVAKPVASLAIKASEKVAVTALDSTLNQVPFVNFSGAEKKAAKGVVSAAEREASTATKSGEKAAAKSAEHAATEAAEKAEPLVDKFTGLTQRRGTLISAPERALSAEERKSLFIKEFGKSGTGGTLVISDLHLGNKKAEAETRKVFETVLKGIESKGDTIKRIYIGGDLIDAAKGAERPELALAAVQEIRAALDKTPGGPKKAIIITLGNHDVPRKEFLKNPKTGVVLNLKRGNLPIYKEIPDPLKPGRTKKILDEEGIQKSLAYFENKVDRDTLIKKYGEKAFYDPKAGEALKAELEKVANVRVDITSFESGGVVDFEEGGNYFVAHTPPPGEGNAKNILGDLTNRLRDGDPTVYTGDKPIRGQIFADQHTVGVIEGQKIDLKTNLPDPKNKDGFTTVYLGTLNPEGTAQGQKPTITFLGDSSGRAFPLEVDSAANSFSYTIDQFETPTYQAPSRVGASTSKTKGIIPGSKRKVKPSLDPSPKTINP